MKRTKKNRRSSLQASQKATTPVESRHCAALWLRAVPLLVLVTEILAPIGREMG